MKFLATLVMAMMCLSAQAWTTTGWGSQGTLLEYNGEYLLPGAGLDPTYFTWDGEQISLNGGIPVDTNGFVLIADNMGDADARGSNLTHVASGTGLSDCLWLTNNVLISEGCFYIVPDGECLTDIAAPPCGTIRWCNVGEFSDSYLEAMTATNYVLQAEYRDCSLSPTGWTPVAIYAKGIWLDGDLNMRSNDVRQVDSIHFILSTAAENKGIPYLPAGWIYDGSDSSASASMNVPAGKLYSGGVANLDIEAADTNSATMTADWVARVLYGTWTGDGGGFTNLNWAASSAQADVDIAANDLTWDNEIFVGPSGISQALEFGVSNTIPIVNINAVGEPKFKVFGTSESTAVSADGYALGGTNGATFANSGTNLSVGGLVMGDYAAWSNFVLSVIQSNP